MQYRIIEFKKSKEVYYKLQIKKFFIWVTVMQSDYCTYGIYETDKRFATKESAFEYYKDWYMKPVKKIVQQGSDK